MPIGGSNAEWGFLHPGEEIIYEARPTGYPPPTARIIVYLILAPILAPIAFYACVEIQNNMETMGRLPMLVAGSLALLLAASEGTYYAHWRSTIYLVTSDQRLIAIKQLIFARLRWIHHLEGNESLFTRPNQIQLKEAYGSHTWVLRLPPDRAENIADALRQATGGGPETYPIAEAAEPEGRLAGFLRRLRYAVGLEARRPRVPPE